jgi:phosphoglucosamine mutase
VLVRASGTEPLIRVMVEAPTDEETGAVCARLTELVKAILGAGFAGPSTPEW